ncbi:AraC family transcriptional regulator [Paenibacillus sp. CF384]|uniref:AraC family transcriptional regulator n=1 Tax=Paenibacillus sp. CF384 TaxID=1884382 RepID=UPI0008986B1A|nr:AraC family transcriptional regulator [Paenibacillus sp. CF384]SDW85419.1 AraC-type DNA-binding protein [Paenibacillus sp. CF384]
MDIHHLHENRRHGSPGLPVGIYRMEQGAGEPILDNHWHEEAEFLVVESGEAVFQIGLSTYTVRAGEVLFIPGGELHGGYSPSGGACSYSALVFDLDWLMSQGDSLTGQFLEPIKRGRLVPEPHAALESELALSLLRQLTPLLALEHSEEPAKPLRLKAGLYQLFAEYVSQAAFVRREPRSSLDMHTQERLKTVLSYIDGHYARKLTIKELAAEAGMSEGHFTRVFKSFMRKTPIEYINLQRIRIAAALLADSNTSVGEAALESGFDNFSYFCKMFRSVYQCTPSDYRHRHGAE